MAKLNWVGFVGFVGGGIDVESCVDEHGDYHAVQIFRTPEEAAKRYDDVREVCIRVEGPAVPTDAP